jgi:hypothetical protein
LDPAPDPENLSGDRVNLRRRGAPDPGLYDAASFPYSWAAIPAAIEDRDQGELVQLVGSRARPRLVGTSGSVGSPLCRGRGRACCSCRSCISWFGTCSRCCGCWDGRVARLEPLPALPSAASRRLVDSLRRQPGTCGSNARLSAARLADAAWQGSPRRPCGVRKVGSGGVAVFVDESAEPVASL